MTKMRRDVVLSLALVGFLGALAIAMLATEAPVKAPRRLAAVPFPDGPRPRPSGSAFAGCPFDGDGGDPELNRRKNRADVPASCHTVSLRTILRLPVPDHLPRERSNWSSEQESAVGRYEGTPITLECRLVTAHAAGAESCNCGATAAGLVDWHLGAVEPDNESAGLPEAVIAEVTARGRRRHPEWRLADLRRLAKDGTKLRLSGWLMLDPEHEGMISEGYRGTLWELHPVTRIEVKTGGRWVELGK